MVVTTTLMSLREFLSYEDETDTCYELENGKLIAMAPESELNQRIASFLFAYFLRVGISFERLRMKTEVVVSGTRATVRVPDFMVLSDELVAALEGATQATVMLEMPPPRLVVEIVSPGKKNVDRDYRYKKSQYEARGIEEYWIVDPIVGKVTVFSLVEGLYEVEVFEGDEMISSDMLAALEQGEVLLAAKVLGGSV
jgi:Uma2 family endonuclease